ncbi:hypothetical protein CHS0354_030960 [Potamilus streckersoni]|uniref:Uncharacterized protein n=1 Tax=Potamilus streckersoni TaxID=2493646 RepID=A0AAE0SF29_9BIVA|nr:hypothetical protein CHS0354_030960 [Potamilus streckersoni]
MSKCPTNKIKLKAERTISLLNAQTPQKNEKKYLDSWPWLGKITRKLTTPPPTLQNTVSLFCYSGRSMLTLFVGSNGTNTIDTGVLILFDGRSGYSIISNDSVLHIN